MKMFVTDRLLRRFPMKGMAAFLLTFFLPAITWAVDAAIQAQLATARENLATALAKELYCQAATTIGGDLGLMIGLCISAFALYCLIFKGPSLMFVVLFVFGLLITSLPTWFQTTYHSLEKLTASLGSGSTAVSTDLTTTNFRANCDYGSTSIKQQMNSIAAGASTGTGAGGGTGTAGTGTYTQSTTRNCTQANSSSVISGSSTCTSGYGINRTITAGGTTTNRTHHGIDFAATTGTEVTSALDGTVFRTGNDPNGYGNFVVIDYGNGIYGRYSHLQSATTLSAGDTVTSNTVVGYVGSSGRSTGAHLDYSETTNGYGAYVDPCGSSGTGAVCN